MPDDEHAEEELHDDQAAKQRGWTCDTGIASGFAKCRRGKVKQEERDDDRTNTGVGEIEIARGLLASMRTCKRMNNKRFDDEYYIQKYRC